MRTKINNFIDMWTGVLPPDTEVIVMELGDDWREKTLEHLEELLMQVSRKRWFGDYVMRFRGIKESSVDLVFSLPESVEIQSLELESLREFFQEHQVLRILFNGTCILNLQLQQVTFQFKCTGSFMHSSLRRKINLWGEPSDPYWNIERIHRIGMVSVCSDGTGTRYMTLQKPRYNLEYR